jgi:hypothetical protein
MFPWGIVDKEASGGVMFLAPGRYLRLNKKDNYIEALAEFTQLQMPTKELIQQKGSWYTDSIISQGIQMKVNYWEQELALVQIVNRLK